MSGYSNESNTHSLTQIRRARKEHTCCACRISIKPGHLYQIDKALFDGYWETWKRCGRCVAIYNHLAEKMTGARNAGLRDREEYIEVALNCGHTYQAEWGEEPPPEIANLAFLNADEASNLLEKTNDDQSTE